ncbi:HipA family kinase [Tistlia consotensis]|uniref:HipA family kinase n=1 Tax=Tistlia consotensis TaxID=1321365 RepID=UPI00117E50B9|nr:HipA family kinase [Tistlia consotensis]
MTADEVVREATSGRTGPLLMRCEADTDHPIELFCKLSAGCDEGVKNLARELIAACLAADLELPVPIPYLVAIPPDLVAVVEDARIAARLAESVPIGFGSARVANQFAAWSRGARLTEEMVPVALGTFIFDAVLDNPDRRLSNPNCLVSGQSIRLIDHELAFQPPGLLIGWRPPWQDGGMRWLDQGDGHIFCQHLKRRQLDFAPIKALWSALSDARLSSYRAEVPAEWDESAAAVDEALSRVRNARDNIDGIIAEAERVLQ